MHNWWLATLENVGVITAAQAEHISKEIKGSIHKDSYKEASEDLRLILSKDKAFSQTPISKLEDKLFDLRSEVNNLAKDIETLKAKKAVAKTSKP